MDRTLIAVAVVVVAGFAAWSVRQAGESASKNSVPASAPAAGSGAPSPPDPQPQPKPEPPPRVRSDPAQGDAVPAPARARKRPAGWLHATLLDMSGTTPMDLAEDLPALRDHFETGASAIVADGTSAAAVQSAADGTTLRFPPGCHVFDTRGWNKSDKWPRHLVVEGAGIDKTLVRLSEEICSSRGELTALTLRDLTIHCNDDGLTDLRSRSPATIRLVRCRVIGFDAGHGGCDLFNGNVGAFLAEDSKIELGFGRSPGSTEMFDVRGGACVVRLERCLITGSYNHQMFTSNPNQAFVLVGCTLTGMNPNRRQQIESNPSVRLRDCKVSYVSDSGATRTQRPVSELNPAWVLPKIDGR